jgi:hypothetical protein
MSDDEARAGACAAAGAKNLADAGASVYIGCTDGTTSNEEIRARNMKTQCFMIGASLVVAVAQSLSAHHSFAAEFDANKTVTLKGTVTKLEWTNPHI